MKISFIIEIKRSTKMKLNLIRNIQVSGLATILILILFCDFIEAQSDAQIMHMHRATRRRTAIVVSSVTHEKDQEAYEQQQKQEEEEQQKQETESTQTVQNTQTQQQTTTSTDKTTTTTPPTTTKTADGTLPIGTVVSSLPDGCKSTSVNNQAYYECGGNYYRSAFQGNNLVYVTTDPPK